MPTIFETSTSLYRAQRTMHLARQACLLAAVLGGACVSPAAAEDQVAKDLPSPVIQHVDLVHFSHTDYGYSDHPEVCREMQRRFLDIAIDAVLATVDKPPEAKFCWTAETTVAVDDWWRTATPERRQDFLKAVRSGQLEISALPLNQTATLNRQQWQTMLHWLPEDLWTAVRPKVALQNDVNGFPRAGAMALLDRGIHYFFIGINPEFGGPPLKRPTALWWRMPDRAETVRLAGLSLLGRIFVLRGGKLAPRLSGRHRHALSSAPARRNPLARRVGGPQGPRAAIEAHSFLGGRGIPLSAAVAFGDERVAHRQRSTAAAAGRVRRPMEPLGLEADAAFDDRFGGHETHGRGDRPRRPGL